MLNTCSWMLCPSFKPPLVRENSSGGVFPLGTCAASPRGWSTGRKVSAGAELRCQQPDPVEVFGPDLCGPGVEINQQQGAETQNHFCIPCW